MIITKRIETNELVGMNLHEVVLYLDKYEVRHCSQYGDYLMYVPNFKDCEFVLAFDGDEDLCIGAYE